MGKGNVNTGCDKASVVAVTVVKEEKSAKRGKTYLYINAKLPIVPLSSSIVPNRIRHKRVSNVY